jgi:flagellar FliL protein
MADEPSAEEAEGKSKKKKAKGEKKKGGKKKLLIIGVVVLLGGGFAAKTFLLGGGAPAKAEEEAAPKPGEIVEIDPMTVNLADPGLHYAQVGLGVVLAEGAVADGVTAHLALLKDATISIVGKYRSEELATSKGQDQLRKQLSKAAAKLFEGDVVLKVVLTEIVVQ